MTNSTTETKPLTEQDLKEIEQRCEAATPGPWKFDGDDCDDNDDDPYIFVDVPKTDNGVSVLFAADWGTTEDADFIAHSRTDVRKLLDEVRRERARAEVLEGELKAANSGSGLQNVIEQHEAQLKAEREANAALRADLRTVGEALRDSGYGMCLEPGGCVDPVCQSAAKALSLPSVRELMAGKDGAK